MKPTSTLTATVLVLGAVLSPLAVAHQAKRSYSTHKYYVLEHEPTAPASVDEVTSALGVELVEQVGELQDHWLVRVPLDDHTADTTARSQDGAAVLEKRDAVMEIYSSLQHKAASTLTHRSLHPRRITNAIRSLSPQTPRQRIKRQLLEPADQLLPRKDFHHEPEHATRMEYIKQALHIQDPEFGKQWHILNEDNPPHDMNVTGVWEMGYTGKGIISAIVDDGLDFNSEDLAINYWASGSWDYNDHVATPLPRLFDDKHGTRCAGEVAAARNNICGVGVAFDSKVAGIRILSATISDADEAAALNYGFNETSIYSCSWGPPDDGRSMEAPSSLIQKSVLNGIENGRGGKGSIFVFASGNGAGSGDQCNFDGYTNSIYSITVAAVDSGGGHPYYSETCAANMISAYSSGRGRSIQTTDVGKQGCTNRHQGTSAAAPLVVGVIALALEARPDLSWRDIQHLCVQTAREVSSNESGWEKTAQGRRYNYQYGFGVMDAYRFVTAAKNWTLVKPQAWIEMPQVTFNDANMTTDGIMSGGDFIPPKGLESSMEISQQLLKDNNFEKLEHITVKVWINHSRRGHVEVSLVSPNGVVSMLGGQRPYDQDKSGYPGWTFMTLKHWEENPVGNWTLKVNDQADPAHNGTFLGWTMSFWGSSIDPKKAVLFSHRPQTLSESSSEGDNTQSSNSAITSGGPCLSSLTLLPLAHPWLITLAGMVLLVVIGGGVAAWRRRKARQNAMEEYSSLAAGEEDASEYSTGAEPQPNAYRYRAGSSRDYEQDDGFGDAYDEEEEEVCDEEKGVRSKDPSTRPLLGEK